MSPQAVGNSGGYFAPFGKVDRRPEGRWEGEEGEEGEGGGGIAERLWVESERMLGGKGL